MSETVLVSSDTHVSLPPGVTLQMDFEAFLLREDNKYLENGHHEKFVPRRRKPSQDPSLESGTTNEKGDDDTTTSCLVRKSEPPQAITGLTSTSYGLCSPLAPEVSLGFENRSGPSSASIELNQASPSHLALPAADNAQHAARSIIGDKAWPPIRPPSPRPCDGTTALVPSQLAPDLAIESQRARTNFREEPARASTEEAHAALQRLLARTKSIPASIPNALVVTRPLAPSPLPCTARIDPEAFIEPEPQVNTCDLDLSQTAPSVLPRVISRQEMNGKWHLNTPTIPRNHSKDHGADGGACGNQECKGQPVEASTIHGRNAARPACATNQGAGGSNWGRSEG